MGRFCWSSTTEQRGTFTPPVTLQLCLYNLHISLILGSIHTFEQKLHASSCSSSRSIPAIMRLLFSSSLGQLAVASFVIAAPRAYHRDADVAKRVPGVNPSSMHSEDPSWGPHALLVFILRSWHGATTSALGSKAPTGFETPANGEAAVDWLSDQTSEDGIVPKTLSGSQASQTRSTTPITRLPDPLAPDVPTSSTFSLAPHSTEIVGSSVLAAFLTSDFTTQGSVVTLPLVSAEGIITQSTSPRAQTSESSTLLVPFASTSSLASITAAEMIESRVLTAFLASVSTLPNRYTSTISAGAQTVLFQTPGAISSASDPSVAALVPSSTFSSGTLPTGARNCSVLSASNSFVSAQAWPSPTAQPAAIGHFSTVLFRTATPFNIGSSASLQTSAPDSGLLTSKLGPEPSAEITSGPFAGEVSAQALDQALIQTRVQSNIPDQPQISSSVALAPVKSTPPPQLQEPTVTFVPVNLAHYLSPPRISAVGPSDSPIEGSAASAKDPTAQGTGSPCDRRSVISTKVASIQ